MIWRGVFTISATPFAPDGALDLDSTDRLVDFYLERGVHGLTILGIMGEAHKLSHDESVTFSRAVLRRVGGAVPVLVGASHPGLDNLVRLARDVMESGAAGVMVSPAMGLRSEDQVLGYFGRVFAALGPEVPVCLQDYPQASGVYLSVDTLRRLFVAYPQLAVFKHEDCPGLAKLSRVRAAADDTGRQIAILTGNGGLYLPQELARGADGSMTGFAFPEMLVGVWERVSAGDLEGAEDLFDTYLPVLRHEQQPGFGLAIRKEILCRRGAIKSATVRQPGPVLDATDLRELDGLLTRLMRRVRTSGSPVPAGGS